VEAADLPGTWVRYTEGEISKPKDGDVYALRLDEPHVFVTTRGDMPCEVGDFIMFQGHEPDDPRACWPCTAAELGTSDGRWEAIRRYQVAQ
jgi:hypothetical protein